MSLRSALVMVVLATMALVVPSAQVRAAENLTVINCATDTQFLEDLSILQAFGGGTISFNCGTATIPVTATLPTITKSTSVAGNDTITLNGSGRRLFQVNSGGSLSLGHIVLENGYFDGNGGSILNAGSLTLNHVTIRDSDVPNDGGAIYTSGPATIQNSTFGDDQANFGGAIFATGASASVTITNSSFHGNSVTGVTSDARDGLGGAIYLTNGAAATIGNTELYSNTAFDGGGIALTGATTSLTLLSSDVHDNTASQEWGGGVYNTGRATVTVQDSTIAGNTARIGGGITIRSGTLNVTDSTFSGNEETLGGYAGGGLDNDGTATLTGVTFSGNTAAGGGAGMSNAYGATATLTNVTFSGNIAGAEGGAGGGFFNYGSTANLTNVTFSGNSATTGGGISSIAAVDPVVASHVSLLNVVVANSPAGGNCSFDSALASNVTNMSSDATCGFGSTGDSRAVLLNPLADNGGPTETLLPQSSSPLVDAGTNAGAPSHDQRGVLRPQDGTVDIGAVEVVSTTVQSSDPSVQYDGWRGVRDNDASGGSYRVSNTSGETVKFSFSGKTLTWVTRKAPNAGEARVTIDGVTKCTCDLYASSIEWRQKFVFNGLGGGAHTVTTTVTGNKNSHSHGTNVAVDGFITSASASVIQETSTGVRFDDWVGAKSASALGGDYRIDGTSGADATVRFDGTKVIVLTAKGPSYGKVNVLIDGVVVSSNLDLYAATEQWQFPLTYSGLSASAHTLEIRPTHTRNASSSGFGVVVDAFTGLIDTLPPP